MARIAATLCKLLDGMGAKSPLALIDAHVNAIRVIVKQKMKAAADEIALTLLQELDARVNEALAKVLK